MSAGHIVWLHGFMGCPGDLRPIQAEMDRLGSRAAVHHGLLLPGHGEQPEAVPATVGEWIAWVGRRLPADPCLLAGYSLGARLAMQVALAMPQRVAGLLLMAGDPGIELETDRRQRRQRDGQWAQRFRTEALAIVLEAWYRQPIFAPLVEQVGIDSLVKRRAGNQGSALGDVLDSFGSGVVPPAWDGLARLDIPAAFVAGSLDARYAGVAGRLAGPPWNWSCVTVERAGHALPLEAPAEVAREFVNQLESWKWGDTR